MSATCQVLTSCVEVRLDDHEKRLESSTFLARLVGGMTAYSSLMLLFEPVLQYPLIYLVPFSLIIFCLAWSLARMWRSVVAVGITLLSLAWVLPFFVGVLISNLSAQTMGIVSLIFAICFTIGLGLQIIVDGWRL